MNCRSKTLAGALLSVKNLFTFGRSTHSKLIHRQILTPDQLPKNNVVPATFGQPTHLTHPHIIKKGEVGENYSKQSQFGITIEEFKLRRSQLLEAIKSHTSRHDAQNKTFMVIIPSSCKKYMTEKIPYVFRQNTDFLYLTGCLEQDSLLVLCNQGDKDESIIFVRGRDPQSELWDGPRTGVDQAVELFGVDKALPMREFEIFVSSFLKENKDCGLWYDYINDIHPKVHSIMQLFLTRSKEWESPRRLIHLLRVFKSPAEQELLKKSCEVGAQAIKQAIADSRPWDTEAFIQARVDFYCRMNGAEYLAYPPVVAAGDRANIIHYINNNHVVEDGDLVLMDAGCEYHGYCSDISRTWPISRKFTQPQRTLYEVVYSVQMELIEKCSGFPSLDELYFHMMKILGARLQESGIISSTEDVSKIMPEFCPHHVSHYLGMDVHDTSTVVRHIPLQPGMVCTIEPGVYINKNNKHANPEFRGLGIRIEDDILMTESGALVLSASCPKHPDEIANLLST